MKLVLPALLALSVSAAFAQDVTGEKMAKMPNLVTGCANLCPNSKNDNDVLACVDKFKATRGGESGLRNHDETCAREYEKYQRMSGRTAKERVISPRTEPYRYG